MTPLRKLQFVALTVVMGGALLLTPEKRADAAPLGCPGNIPVDSCLTIPADMYEECAGCGRQLGCVEGPGGAIAGCQFET